jgi:hypothetical protein
LSLRTCRSVTPRIDDACVQVIFPFNAFFKTCNLVIAFTSRAA